MRISDWSSDVCSSDLVRALWADVKLWRNEYQACLDLCLQLDAQYAGSMVRPLDWYSIFNPGNSTESIFELQYMLEGPNSPLYNWFSHTNKIGRASCRERVCQYV